MKSKLNITTVLGLVIAFGGIGLGYFLEGGDFKALIAISPILIIFGGTIGAVIMSISLGSLKKAPGIIKKVFTDESYDYVELIEKLCEWAKLSRTQGIIALDNLKNDIPYPFVQRGVGYIVDSIDPENVKDFLENEIGSMEMRHSENAKIIGSAGGYAPTMGILGAVMGLVIVLSGLGNSSVEELGHGIAVAFLATFMGVGVANLVFVPLADKLKAKTAEEVLYREIAMHGILGIQAQDSPILLEKKLYSFLPDNVKKSKEV